MDDIDKIRKQINTINNKTIEDLFKSITVHFGEKNICFATSFSAEDQIIIDVLSKSGTKINVFTLDTGKLPQETYDVMNKTTKKYNINIEILYPDKKSVENLEKDYGPDLFYDSIEKRKMCCDIRKIQPLKKHLSKYKAWICGLRRDQSVTRENLQILEKDGTFGLIKINPLIDWTEDDVWEYINKNNVPYNKLHDKGYPSIGCAPCTRAIKPGEDIRSGRWWWETPEQKECGLHIENGKVVRKNTEKG